MAKNKRKKHTILSGAFAGMAVTVMCCSAGAALVAYCALNEWFTQQGSGIGIAFIVVLSVMAGDMIAASTVSEKKVLTGILSSAIVLLAILSVALLLDGPFMSILPTTASIGIGTIIVCLIYMKKQKKPRHCKNAYR